MKTLFFDEAGYTGSKLSDRDQPVFVLASHAICETDSAALLKSFFPSSTATEIKHKDLRKGAAARAAVVELVKAIVADDLPFAQFIVHKRFALFQRFFDYLVEPVMKDQNFEAYDDSFNIEATLTGYLALPPLIGDRRFHRVLELFEVAARTRSYPHLNAAWQCLERAKAGQVRGGTLFLDMLLCGKIDDKLHLSAIPENALDVSLSTMVALVVHWRRLSLGPFEIVHDQSSALTTAKAMWDWLSSPDQQEQTLGFGDFRDMVLPMNVARTEFARSHDHAGLQLADILAGAQLEVCRYRLGSSTSPDYASNLADAGLDTAANSIWPDPNWSKPESSRSSKPVDPLDFIASGPRFGRRR